MKKQELEFRFEGKQAEADAQELAGFLAQEFPDWPSRVGPSQPSPNPPGTRDAATTIVIIALIVALPSGIKDGLELADRLIAWAKHRRARRQRNPFIALPPHGTSLPLDQVKPEQLLDAVAAQAWKPPQKSLSS